MFDHQNENRVRLLMAHEWVKRMVAEASDAGLPRIGIAEAMLLEAVVILGGLEPKQAQQLLSTDFKRVVSDLARRAKAV